MPQSRSMSVIGKRVHELRINDAGKEWRIIYRIDPDAIVIAEVFRGHRGIGMKAEKRKRLEEAGWRVSDADEFLGLSKAEADFIRMKAALARQVRQARER